MVDPAADDPLAHIAWVPIDPSVPRRRWLWTPRGTTARGWKTIEVLGLDDIADRVGEHLTRNVLARVEEVEEHVDAGRHRAARTRWAQALDDQLHRRAEYRAATWCALQRWAPPPYRAMHGLIDPPRP